MVPAFVLDRYWAGDRHGRIHAAVLFIDTVGFSALSSQLTQNSDHGAEVLAEVMGQFFSEALEMIFAFGGFVENISGDSVTAIFPDTSAEQALPCARAIQAFLHESPIRSGDWTFTARLGLAEGKVSWRIFSNAGDGSAAFCFDGPPITHSVDAQERSAPGEIVAHSSFRGMSTTTGEPLPDDPAFVRVERGRAPDVPAAPPLIQMQPERTAPFLPAALVSRRIPGEFRQVVSMFVRIEGAEDGRDLEEFNACFMATRERWGGIGTRLNIGDKGVTVFQFWGAPDAQEHDVSRAINFAINLTINSPLDVAVGLSLGVAFTGFIGSDRYAEFAGFGQPTNLAARLMSKAPRGAIWGDAAIAARAAGGFEIEDAGEHLFKGFKDPEKVFAIKARHRDRRVAYDSPLVGRADSTKAVADHLEKLKTEGSKGAFVIRGEAGVGKSHLIDHIRTRHQSLDGTEWLQTYCDPLIQTSLEPFRRVLRTLFGPDALASKAVFSRRLARISEACDDPDLRSDLLRFEPYVADILGRPGAGSALEGIEPKARLANSVSAILVVIQVLAMAKPTVLVIEDAHWLDDDSRPVLLRLIRRARGSATRLKLAVILTTRPTEHELDADAVQSVLDLQPISGSDLKELVETQLKGPASGGVLSLVRERSQGNPLFGTQVLRFLRERGLLEHVAGVWHLAQKFDQMQVPGDVGTLLIARIDKLSQTARDLVAIGAVLGTEFDVSTLFDVARKDLISARGLEDASDEILRSGLWAQRADGGLVFGHALTRDAAYSMQIMARRTELHAHAAEVLEADSRVEPGVLAVHFDKAGHKDRARSLYLVAADKAEKAYQRTELIAYLDRAIELSEPGATIEKFELGDRLAEALRRTGDFRRQLQNIERQEKWADALGPMERLRAATRLQSYHFVVGDMHVGVSLGTAIAKNLDPSLHGTVEASDFFRQLCMNQHFADKSPDPAAELASANAALEHAQKSGQSTAIASAYSTLGHIYRYVDDPLAKSYYEKALAIGPVPQEVLSTKNRLASIARRQGDLDTAETLCKQVLQASMDAGDFAHSPLLHRSLAAIAREKLDWRTARHHYEQGMSSAREINNMREYLVLVDDQVGGLITCGLFDEAWPLVQKNLAQAKKTKSVQPFYAEHLKVTISALRGDDGWMREASDRYLPRLMEAGFTFDIAKMQSLIACGYLHSSDNSRGLDMINDMGRTLASQDPLRTRYAMYVGDAAELRAVHQALRGLLFWSEGDQNAASVAAHSACGYLEQCLREHANPSQRPPFPESLTFCLLCDLLERVGQHEQARATFRIWRQTFDKLVRSMTEAGYDHDSAWREDVHRSKLMERYEPRTKTAATG